MVKNLPANTEDTRDSGWIPGSGRSPEGGHGNPLQDSCLENPCGQRSLADYSPWGHKESDMSEQLSIAQSLYNIVFISAEQQHESAISIHISPPS